ncbi:MAG TPA: hypothetical protein VG457_18140 [Planctomycetota bacterium]|jgi:hypothetical protein|nr:hypothetical protein [Planctomycetota bacterium]
MPLFQVLGYLSPLLVGFAVAAAMSLTAGQAPYRRARAATGVVLGVLVLLLVASLGDSPKHWLPLSVVLVSLALLIVGIYLLAESARMPREICQVLAGLALCFLMSTLFWAGPLIRAAADRGATGEAIYRRITLSLDVNPFFVIGYSIFEVDLIHSSSFFYRLGMADFQHGTPSWGASSAGFAALGLIFASVAVGLRRVLKP